jgi:hypothetical protein
LYSNLRFVISASVVGCAGLIGVLALLPATLEERLLASAELSAPAARPCKQQNWLNLDRNCLTRRGMPWVAALPARGVAEVPASAETAAEQPLTETPSPAATAQEVAPPSQVTASRQETATAAIAEDSPAAVQASETVPQPQQEAMAPQQTATAPPQEPAALQQEPVPPQQVAVAPQQEPVAPQQAAAPAEPQHTTKRRSVTPVRHAAPAAPAVAEKRRAAKANVETPPRVGAAKTAGREDRGAKPANEAVETQMRAGGSKTAARENRGAKPANEALNAVRRFQDNLRDVPVSSYAADGTRRTIVIRPTSIQDVYYYSAPR